MHYKQFDRKFFIKMDKGEEIVSGLKDFCLRNNIKLGLVSGIGAVNQATVGLFDPEAKKYCSRELKGDFEIISLLGNITAMSGEPYLHLHIALGDEEQKVWGGHLTSAVVSATFEGVIEAISGEVNRKFDEAIGLNILDI